MPGKDGTGPQDMGLTKDRRRGLCGRRFKQNNSICNEPGEEIGCRRKRYGKAVNQQCQNRHRNGIK